MASSTVLAAPSSPVVANVAPPPATTMEGKMDARLLALACSGSFQDLESLLDGQPASSKGTIGSSAMQPASPSGDDVEAFLRESLPYAVTAGGDTLLHVVAASYGHHEDFLKKASLIHTKAQNLLFVENNMGDTPLHYAARAGNIQMVSLLIDLAKENNTANGVKELLEKESKIKRTALHEAICSGNNDIVKVLMEENPLLASLPKNDTSPLYLAISLEKKTIAETLYELSSGVISYSGPAGQNALHIAAQRSQDLTKMLLEWNNDLTLQGDMNGYTPLHFSIEAVLWQSKRKRKPVCSEVLKANPNALYQPDHNGSFPTHVAASVGATWAIIAFIKESPNCVGLLDAKGRSFLHVAVDKVKTETVDYTCRNMSLSWILNMQDKDGNTALHLAVEKGSLIMFCSLFRNIQVHMNLTNEKGQTPLDIAYDSLPKGLYSAESNEAKILKTLKTAGAKRGTCSQRYLRQGDIEQARQKEKHITDQVKEGTQGLCIGAALIVTVTFGATFAMPGGYRTNDQLNGGTPTLAGRYTFDVFTLANALAFASAAMATISLMFSGAPMLHPRSRVEHLFRAYMLMSASVTCLVVAFAIGTYMMLAPVAPMTAGFVCAISFLILLYQHLDPAANTSVLVVSVCRRKGICHSIVWTLPLEAFTFVGTILVRLWPMVVIVGYSAQVHIGNKVPSVAQPPTPFA